MLRIHLTAEDLLKTRFASQPAPLVETGLAIAALKRREPLFRAWRRSAAARFPLAARPLLELIPPSATGPLFLDPLSADLAEGLELVQSAPASYVTEELRRVAGSRPPGRGCARWRPGTGTRGATWTGRCGRRTGTSS